MKFKKFFRKQCKRCNEIFTPNSKYSRICFQCKEKTHAERYPSQSQTLKFINKQRFNIDKNG